jgi:transcription elongation factor Elf1
MSWFLSTIDYSMGYGYVKCANCGSSYKMKTKRYSPTNSVCSHGCALTLYNTQKMSTEKEDREISIKKIRDEEREFEIEKEKMINEAIKKEIRKDFEEGIKKDIEEAVRASLRKT